MPSPDSLLQASARSAQPSRSAANIRLKTVTVLDNLSWFLGRHALKFGFQETRSAILNSSGVAAYTTSSLAVGQHSIAAVYGGDANNAGGTSAVLTQIVNTVDFVLSSTSSSATVSAGSAASFTVTVTSQGSFTNPISFSCSGLPALANCTFSPSTVTPIPMRQPPP